ncbi:MAG: TlpA family protein disulfide reductase [Candidatus Eisenbacteria bacterium]|uniref:TlpA family protein disulfide reductase n=1 Tax=Eiseniibacteriota bacterium TaxID=2212470 RepID=A0A7Y2E9X5_UNCEI|nr:TlpA family protein disulfide reductase [Candidatus Eisenbacteria bacterium]
MKQLLVIATLVASFTMVACSENKAEGDATAKDAAAKNVDAVKTGAEIQKPNKDLAEAEARRQSQNRGKMDIVAKPAIETASLREAPPWTVQDLEGNPVSKSDFLGKVVILDFWATWCGPCKMEIPHFIELQEEYGDNLVIVGVSVDREGPAKVAPFAAKANINYPMVMVNSKIAKDYEPITSIPTTFVITQDGKIYKRYTGYRPKAIFENDIKTLLGISS